MIDSDTKNTARVVMPLEGVHCASCVARIERALAQVSGVVETSVHLPTRTAFITYQPSVAQPAQLKAVIEKLGYKVLEVAGETGSDHAVVSLSLARENTTYMVRFWAAAALAVVVLLSHALMLSEFTVWLAATASWAWCGAHFHKGFFKATRSWSPDMNTLVSMSTTTAYLYSCAVALFPARFAAGNAPMWHELVMLVAFINLGRWLETRSRKNTGAAIGRLLLMAPRFARILENGREKTIRATEVKPGQTVLLNPGEQFPVDGVVLQGISTADESMLTGESMPVDKMPDSLVLGGTLNKQGMLQYRATGTGKNSALARIVEAVRMSQSAKTPVQQLVDRISFYFVPAVFLIAIGAGLAWGSFIAGGSLVMGVSVFVAVLAAACPCAMGLAVPMALAVGMDRAAGMGILIRNPDALERATSIGVVVIDKTGTLTQGKLAVEKLLPSGCDEDFLLRNALIAEGASEHPFALAIRKYAAARKLDYPRPDAAQAQPGSGMKASFGSSVLLAGKAEWLVANGVKVPADNFPAQGRSVVAVACDGKFLGRILLADRLRPSATVAVRKLRDIGMDVFLVSGDRREAVSACAAEAGIKEYYAEVLPEEKAAFVAQLQAKGRRTAMVGDGFNDAPALSRADIGIAFSSGTDVAIEAADLVLMRQSLDAVSDSILLSRAIRGVIKQNLFWAFIYNVTLLPLAAGALYPWWHKALLPPSLAAAAMALSSVSVVFNSLRLRNIKL